MGTLEGRRRTPDSSPGTPVGSVASHDARPWAEIDASNEFESESGVVPVDVML